MSDRQDPTDDAMESEIRSWFKSRRTPAAPSTLRAFADEVGSGARPTAPVRRLAVGWRHAPGGRLAAVATSIAIVVLAGGLLLVVGQRGPAAPTSPPVTSQPAAASIATLPSPTPSPDVTARYPDGIPSTFLGQHVYRPGDLAKTVPTGPFLLGGWDAGAVVSACIPMIEGASNPPCPSFGALAETRGGPMVIAVRWGPFSVHGSPALVLRVTAEPAPTCVSTPPGGCPGVSVTVQDVLWAGDPGPGPPSTP